jgi:imidazoleglycerol phosphate dehydratase HisB
VQAKGDLHIDDHHTVEDCGIALGQALAQALGDKRGIRRYGACLLPMDDALVRAALDLSGRPYLGWAVELPHPKIGTFDTELVREFFQALSTHGGITLHVDGCTASTATMSPRPRSRPWRGRCARRSSPIRARAMPCPSTKGDALRRC